MFMFSIATVRSLVCRLLLATSKIMENSSFSHDQHIPSFSQNSCTGASAIDRPVNNPDTAVDQIFRPRPTAISQEDDVVAIEQETGSIAHDTAEGWS